MHSPAIYQTNTVPMTGQHAAAKHTLGDIDTGSRARICAIDGNREMIHRLMSLGITVGSEVTILHHRGKGVVVAMNGNRVALGDSIAAQIIAEVISGSGDHEA